MFTPEDFWQQQIDGNALHTQQSQLDFFQPLGLAKIGKKIQSIEILFQPLDIPTIEIGENTSYCRLYFYIPIFL